MFKDKSKTLIHFIGIGGIGMSGIAEILLRMGYQVSGSDLKLSPITSSLERLGAKINQGHAFGNLADDTTVVVYSSAIDESNPEVQKSRELNIPMIKRAEMLAELMRLKYGLAVAGTHGKTTTSSILATILHECGIDPTHIIGGVVSNLGGNAKLGNSEFLVAEADESDGSFLLLNPVLSVITNIDNDHLDFYGNEENIYEAFLKFSNKVPFYGFNAFNIHDEKIKKLITQTKKPYVTFGIDTKANYVAKEIKNVGSSSVFKFYHNENFITDVKLNLLGDHNVLNALGALAIGHQVVSDLKSLAEAVSAFGGVGRRFEKLFEKNKFEIIDDYGHHPTEVMKTIETAKNYRGSNLIVLFEPHRFTRTKDCWDDFKKCFEGDVTSYVLPIYPASEQPIEGITSENLVAEMPHAQTLKDWTQAEELIKSKINEDVLVLTLGAGSIGRNIRNLVASLK